MGLNIGGNTITQASSVLTVSAGAAMQMRSAGAVVRPNQCQFQAIGNQAITWVDFPVSTWNKMPFVTALLNINACYSTATSRFTAPVAGMYLFQASCWILKDGANDGYYFHPIFGVNGQIAGGTAAGQINYRIRGYGIPFASYSDSQITQVYSLAAGDFVEHYIYTSPGPSRYHAPYQRFTGFLLG
jgi:hypothetical protein